MSLKRQPARQSEPKAPDFRAYSVKEGKEGQPGHWTPIGVAFCHDDNYGMTILLDALPLSARIVLRTPEQERA